MSQSNDKEVTLMRIEIGMDSATKAAFEEFKAKCSETLDKLSAIASQTKQADGGLLRAMEAEAANDATKPDTAKLQEITALEKMIKNGKANLKKRLSNNGACRVTENTQKEIDRWEVKLSTLKLANNAPSAKSNIPELQQLGQWVFEGCDEKWQSAALNADGRAYRHNYPLALIYNRKGIWVSDCFSEHEVELIEANFDCNHSIRAIQRQSVNDVDYLTEPNDYPDALEQSNWLSESVAPITKTDLQSIFIKNLATVLIQRMHSMDRFSEDDYHIGGDKLLSWDVVIYEPIDAYAVLVSNVGQYNIADLLFFRGNRAVVDVQWNTESAAFAELRTITQDELNAFRTALESCYV